LKQKKCHPEPEGRRICSAAVSSICSIVIFLLPAKIAMAQKPNFCRERWRRLEPILRCGSGMTLNEKEGIRLRLPA
jgi:hypothetical protein